MGSSLLFGKPSRAKLFDKVSRAKLFSKKVSQAKPSLAEPSQARLSLNVRVPTAYHNQFVLKWSDPPIIQDILMNKYDVVKHLEYDNDTLPKIINGVELTLCTKLSYHIVEIYIPTLALIMIAGFTLLIDFRHFEVTVMIALTSMLVLYTLYQSISQHLPHTSYMKMIDIWLFGGLIFPFIIITILVIMDLLVTNEKNQVIDMNKIQKYLNRRAIF